MNYILILYIICSYIIYFKILFLWIIKIKYTEQKEIICRFLLILLFSLINLNLFKDILTDLK